MRSRRFRTCPSVVLLIVALAAPLAAAPSGLMIGDRMPQTGIRSQTLKGELQSIDNFQGDGGTLVVFAGTCAESSTFQATAIELARLFKAQGVLTVFVNSGAPASADAEAPAGIASRALPYLIDERAEVARAYGASRVSEAFLFDGNGRLVYRGAVADADSAAGGFLAEALESLVARRAIVTEETPARGCEISFRD